MGFENRFYSQAENELNEIVIKNRRIHENREKRYMKNTAIFHQ